MAVKLNADNRVESWTVTETTTTHIPGSPLSGGGVINATGVFPDTIIEEDVEFITPLGQVEGWVQTGSVLGSDDMEVSFNLNIVTLINMLAVTRDVPPVIGATVEEVIETYLLTVLDSLPPIVYEHTNTDTFDFIGWNGTVKDGIESFCAMNNLEMAFDGRGLIVRDLHSREMVVDDKTEPALEFTVGNTGRVIEVSYQNQQVVQSLNTTITNKATNPSFETDLTGWSRVASTNPDLTSDDFTRTTLWSANGTYSAEHRQTSLAPTSDTLHISTVVPNITPGEPLRVMAQTDRNGSEPVRMVVTLRDAGNTVIQSYTVAGGTNFFLPEVPAGVTNALVEFIQDWSI